MKKHLSVLIVLALSASLVVCRKQPAGIPSAEKTSFDAVTSRLDKGGSLYLYLGAEKTAQKMQDLAAKIREIVASQPAGSQAQKDQILRAFDFVVHLVKKSGLTEISGFGASTVAMTEDLNHSKLIAHHYRGNGNGLLWQMWEGKPHPLTALRLLPADTVLAQFSDNRLRTMWQAIRSEAEASGLPEFKQGLESFNRMLDKQGIPLDALLESLDGSSGFLLTLDREKKSTIPAGPMKLEIPEPGLAIVLGVKDSKLFDFIASKLTFAEKSEDQGVRRLRVPALPSPVPLQPEIVQSDNLLILASNAAVTEAIFSARDRGDGLVSTQEFKELAKNIPELGNGFGYMGPRFSQQIMDIQQKALQSSGAPQEGRKAAAEILNMFSKGTTWYGVLQNTDEGLVDTFNHSTDLEDIALMSAAGAIGAAVAAIIPNLTRIKNK